jgi:hypothetical protein
MCNEADRGEGMGRGLKDSKKPDIIDRTNGFLVSRISTVCNAIQSVDVSAAYNSIMVIAIMTDTGEIKAEAMVANPSPLVGKANEMKGIPKKERLPKVVLSISRYNIFFENRNIRKERRRIVTATRIGRIPANIYDRRSTVKFVSANFIKNKAGSAK